MSAGDDVSGDTTEGRILRRLEAVVWRVRTPDPPGMVGVVAIGSLAQIMAEELDALEQRLRGPTAAEVFTRCTYEINGRRCLRVDGHGEDHFT